MKTLIIVESPTKARTLSKFLGKDYVISASMGHIRDLPKGKLGVDVEHNFEPTYSVARDKLPTVKDLKAKAEDADLIILATDPDREGEAIAWHLAFLLANKKEIRNSIRQIGGRNKSKNSKSKKSEKSVPCESTGLIRENPDGQSNRIVRITFHEITEKAIREALAHPGEIDIKLVNAQQARRILDRLVGYKLSPLLWKKIKKGLSAGRVQSVAVRLIVEREREIEKFKVDEYWEVEGKFEAENSPSRINDGDVVNEHCSFSAAQFAANMVKVDNKKPEIKTKEEAEKLKTQLEQQTYSVSSFEQKEVKRSPYPPFTTSTLQQGASNLFGWAAKRTMQIAQRLYEQGLITYMRTDSVNLNIDAVNAARNFIARQYGKEFIPGKARFYKTKSKNAQEAHEAIRPTDINFGVETHHDASLQGDEGKLYDLIRKRMLACQMSDALFTQRSVDIENDGRKYMFRGTSSELKFSGWKIIEIQNANLKMQNDNAKFKMAESIRENPLEIRENPSDTDTVPNLIPILKVGEEVKLVGILPSQHFTQPPPRYTEASLIKALEELGIGRPSTYAPTISTIQDRFYVEKEEKKLKPTSLGMSVNDFLMKYFADILDYQFTAGVENSLDEVAAGEKEWVKVLSDFYFPFEKHLNEIQDTAERVKLELETTDEVCENCGKPMVVRIGRFGKFLACSGFPECKTTKPIKQLTGLTCPKCGAVVIAKKTKKGRIFFSCSAWPKCDFAAWKREEVLRHATSKVLGGEVMPSVG